ncbi:MAG TPA: cation transporter [Gallionellaceae bacterium]|nr:cation transporter [Gallionellaceae bacterium]
MGADERAGAAQGRAERTTLIAVLAINAFMFAVELAAGLLADSAGLIADSLDMFADATVYALSLYAVGRSARLKSGAAGFAGAMQIALALLVLADVRDRFLHGSAPMSGMMMGMGLLALAANGACLTLLSRHSRGGVHMRASLIFSEADVIANLGVILSGVLVWATHSRYPDLLIGLAIALVVLGGGIRILRTLGRPPGAG